MRKLANFRLHIQSDEGGFLMPTIIILIVVMSSVAYATLISANNGLNIAYKQSYIQMAREASKAAIDYAQEQFDNANCGAYSGTAETVLTGTSTSRYKITMQADVQSTSTDGYEKKVIGTGRVYLPKTSSSALYVFDIRSEIVRTYAVCKSPNNFAPLVWYDASDTSTLKTSANTTTITSSGNCANCGNGQSTAVKERVDNGQIGGSGSNNLEFHTCKAADFTTSICNSNATKYLYVGLVFQGITANQGATVSAASLKLVGASPSGTAGAVTHRVCGIYENSTNANKALFSTSTSSQVRTRIQTAGLHTATCQDTTTNSFPPGNTLTLDVTNVVQEMLSNPYWNAANGNLGLAIYQVSGSGSRTAVRDSTELSISYSTGPVQQAVSGGTITQWQDKSSHLYNAVQVFGNAPTRQDNQINGRSVVRFNGGSMIASIVPALTGKREMTVFAVLKPNYSGSGASGRIVSGMTSTGVNDTTSGNSIIPLRRTTNSSSSFSSNYDASNHEVALACSTACSGSSAFLLSSLFGIDTSTNKITSQMKGNGGTFASSLANINPGTPPPAYTFGIDQLYIGGRRTGAMPGSGTDYMNGDYAEIVVYDKALSCHDIENLEEYFRAKWAIAASRWTSTCPPDDVPTL